MTQVPERCAVSTMASECRANRSGPAKDCGFCWDITLIHDALVISGSSSLVFGWVGRHSGQRRFACITNKSWCVLLSGVLVQFGRFACSIQDEEEHLCQFLVMHLLGFRL